MSVLAGRRGRRTIRTMAVAMALLASACGGSGDRRAGTPDTTSAHPADADAVRRVVLDFGERLEMVPVLAPDSVAAAAIREFYADLVTPELLAAWVRDPRQAPGRLTSSPWPDYIEIASVTRGAGDQYLVDADIVERTSADPSGESGRIPVRLTVTKRGARWLIEGYIPDSPHSAHEPRPVST